MSCLDPIHGARAVSLMAFGLALFVFSASDPTDVQAGDRRIELRDGSILTGELVEVANGRYRVRTPLLGEVEVREADVVSIGPGAADSRPGAEGRSARIAELQGQLLADPEALTAVQALQGDPKVQAVLADRELVGLVLSGDLEALQSDPRILRLMEDPAVHAILERVLGH